MNDMKLGLKMEQKLVLGYTAIGVALGFVSDWLFRVDLAMALLVPTAIYFASLVPIMNLVKETKFRFLISNTLITFFLVWIMTWVFLYNL